ncbi:hypothetical protein JG688_00009720 [Phytophthora aleatoria]|uniref:Uncharacterized protein n=1 Tax=Phytophthora aleatoria TaxID=2496075 RepID=A0A8J5IKU1_9STRA|nr:hypothetical protein JG688_00009720 [Phytophthora aleatoria]
MIALCSIRTKPGSTTTHHLLKYYQRKENRRQSHRNRNSRPGLRLCAQFVRTAKTTPSLRSAWCARPNNRAERAADIPERFVSLLHYFDNCFNCNSKMVFARHVYTVKKKIGWVLACGSST